MFNLVRRSSFFRRLVISVFAIPLMFAGGAVLGSLVQQSTVGEVGEVEIPRAEFISRYQQSAEEYRRATGADDIPQQVADELIRRVQGNLLSSYLLQASIEHKNISAPDSAVAREIKRNTEFQNEEGEFSKELYLEFVSDRRYYEEQIRVGVSREPLLQAIQSVPIKSIRERLAKFRRQQRVVDAVFFPLSDLSTITVNVTQEEVNLYYQNNASDYVLREEGTFQYFIVSLDAFTKDVDVEESEVELAYEDILSTWDTAEKRELRHIFVSSQDEADEIYERAQTEDFSLLVNAFSEDAGSQVNGGLLGVFLKGDLPPVMDDALFTMTIGQTHPPVAVDDGFSIMNLITVLSSSPLPALEDIYQQAQQNAKKEKVRDRFNEVINDLGDLSAIEIGSLDNMATTVSLSVQAIATVYRNAEDNQAPFNDEVVLSEMFDPLVVNSGENSLPIALDDLEEVYLFVRSTRYQQAGRQPVSEVAGDIQREVEYIYLLNDLYQRLNETSLIEETNLNPIIDTENEIEEETTAAVEASEPVALEEEEALLILDQLEEIVWEQTQTVVLADDEAEVGINTIDGENIVAKDSDQNQQAFSEEDIDIIFSTDLTKGLPAYAFAPVEDDYDFVRVFRVREVIEGEALVDDFLVIDELLDDLVFRIGSLGYLDELDKQYESQFYDLPDVNLSQDDLTTEN